MDELTPGGPEPADDPAVGRYLIALAAFTPSPRFADRVLARVWRPIPRWLRDFRERVLTPARVRAAAGTLAAGSFLWQAALAAFLVSAPAEARSAVSWVGGEVWPFVWRPAQAYLETGLAMATAYSGALAQHWTTLAAAGAAGLVLLAGCTWGLYRTALVAALPGGRP